MLRRSLTMKQLGAAGLLGLAVALTGVGTALAGDGEREKIKFNAADQAAARAVVLRRSVSAFRRCQKMADSSANARAAASVLTMCRERGTDSRKNTAARTRHGDAA